MDDIHIAVEDLEMDVKNPYEGRAHPSLNSSQFMSQGEPFAEVSKKCPPSLGSRLRTWAYIILPSSTIGCFVGVAKRVQIKEVFSKL